MKTLLEFQDILEQIKGHKTVEEIAKKHKISVSDITRQLEIGIDIEKEHTKSVKMARIIALQHLEEFPDYYTRLKKLESSAKRKISEHNIQENYTRIQKTGNTYSIILNWMGKYKIIQMFFPNLIRPTKKMVEFEINKVYPKATVISYKPSAKDPTKPYFFVGDYNEKSK